MDTLLFAIRALIAIALYAFFGVVLVVLLREQKPARPQQPDAATLLRITGDRGGSVKFTLQSPTWIGRDPNCAIRVHNEFASSRHAWIEWHQDKQAWWIEDNASRNGTLVNNERVMRSELKHTDIISIGGAQFRFETDNRQQNSDHRPQITGHR